MVDAVIAFLQFHLIAMRISVLIEPGPVVKASRIDDKFIAFPPATRISVPPHRVRIVWRFAAIRPDFPQYVVPLEVLNEAVGKLNELHRPREKQKAWNTLGITFANNVISFGRRHGSRSVSRSACIEQFLTQWSHRRNVYAWTAAHAAVSTRSTPDSIQVVWIEWQIGFDLRFARHLTGLSETGG